MILYKAVQTRDDELGEAADFNGAMKAVEEHHFKGLQRAREMHAATEKLHRKRLIARHRELRNEQSMRN
jgi:hypothetical protein